MANSISIDQLRPEIWGKDLWADAIDGLYFMQNGMMGEDKNNIIQIHNDLTKQKGDTKTIGIVAKLNGNGVTGDGELEGNEEELLTYSDSIVIDQIRNAARNTGELDEQKVMYSTREEAKEKLAIWIQEFIERQFFLKLAGVQNTSLTDVAGDTIAGRATWSNTPTQIPDADIFSGKGNRYLCANYTGGVTALATTHTLTPSLITYAKSKAKLAKPKILPLRIKGRDYYLMFVHPWQANDLKAHSTYAQAQREAELRGPDNPIFTGALGVWDGVVIHEHEYVPFLDISAAGNNFTSSSSGTAFANDAFRALLCGRQAGAFLKCKNKKEWVERDFDYGNKLGVSTGLIGGIDKVMFNSKEYGVIAVDTYATPLS